MLLQKEPEFSVAQAKQSHMSPGDWQSEQEGQLAVDVAQTGRELVIVSTLAGAMADRLEVYVHNDLLTVRGMRCTPLALEPNLEYYHQECFWGKFSRTIVLPVDVKGDLARAEYKNGVLTVRIPKVQAHKKIAITIVDD